MPANTNYGTGRRKSSTARVFLRNGSGTITVNGRPLDQYFGRETARMIVRQPLELTQSTDKFDVVVTVAGGVGWTSRWWGPGIRNALVPVITVIGLQFGYLLGGAVLTESVFQWPGLGNLVVEAVVVGTAVVVVLARFAATVGCCQVMRRLLPRRRTTARSPGSWVRASTRRRSTGCSNSSTTRTRCAARSADPERESSRRRPCACIPVAY